MNKDTLTIIEFDKILDKIQEFALTEDAASEIAKIMPSTDYMRIKSLLNETSEAKQILKNSTSIPLLGISGVPFLLDKLSKELILQPDELETIKHVLISTKKFKAFMSGYEQLAPIISQYVYSMYELPYIKEEITRCIYNNRVDDQASSALSKVRKQIYIAEGRIKSKLDSMVKSSTIKKYLQDTSVTIKNNRFVLQVKANNRHDIPGLVIDKSSTGSTFFIEPTGINRLQEELNQLKMDEENEIYQILSYLSSLILESKKEFLITMDTFISYDVIFSKAKFSQSVHGNSVSLNTNQVINIINGRHPLLGEEAVPLNFQIGSDYSALVITGPNTGGKTVALKTIGLFTAMVQAGLHIPVDSGSNIAIYGNILADIGDGQSIEQSLSTFSSHIKKIISILQLANKYTLVILDEIGSGTDPTEGEGLAIAILDALYNKRSTIIATSHYGKVKEYAGSTKGFKNGKMHFNVDTLKPTYRLTIGEAGESNAFVIALRLGLDPTILNHAHQVTYDENKNYQTLLSQNPVQVSKSFPTDTKGKKPKKIHGTSISPYELTNQTISSNATTNISPSLAVSSSGTTESLSTLTNTSVTHEFNVGDQVFIQTLNTKGIVFEKTNPKDEVGVMINRKKIYIHKRKVKLLIPADKLYPDGYDFDIVFKSKEYRKGNNLMKRKYVKDYSLEITEEDL